MLHHCMYSLLFLQLLSRCQLLPLLLSIVYNLPSISSWYGYEIPEQNIYCRYVKYRTGMPSFLILLSF